MSELMQERNEYLDHIARIRVPGEARQVLDIIIRQTLYYQKEQDYIALSQFVDRTGLSKTQIIRGRQKLQKMKLISVYQKVNEPTIYRLNKDFQQWRPFTKKRTFTKKSMRRSPKSKSAFTKVLPTKETITKETTTKEKEKYNKEKGKGQDLLTNKSKEFKDTWQEYLKMRQQIRKPATQKAKELILKNLEKLSPDENVQIRILEQSIANSWQGVFPLKDKPASQEEDHKW